MAATIAKAIGNDYSRTKNAQRLGHESSEGQANTWRTFVTAFVRKDGSGFVEVKRDGQELHYFKFEAEFEPKVLPSGTMDELERMQRKARCNQSDELERMQRVTKQSTTPDTLPPIKMRTRDEVNAHQGNRK